MRREIWRKGGISPEHGLLSAAGPRSPKRPRVLQTALWPPGRCSCPAPTVKTRPGPKPAHPSMN